MSQNFFNQPFVYCSICHRRYANEDPLKLTSCAHILCSSHVNSSKICPVCNTTDISIIKLTEPKMLPNDVRLFFEPIPQMFETLYNVSQFQQNGLIEQIQYYQNHCVKLREKVARQQQLLYKAKQELDSVAHLRNRVNELEQQLQKYQLQQPSASNSLNFFGNRSFRNSQKSSNNDPRPPMTVDLTIDDDINEQKNFVNKLKRTSSLRSTNIKNKNITNGSLHRINQDGRIEPNSDLSNIKDFSIPLDSIAAESTQLAKYICSPSNIPSIKGKNNDSRIPSITSLSPPSGSPVGHSSLTYSSSTGTNKIHNYFDKNASVNTISTHSKQFPSSLDKLRITKRNNTTSSNVSRSISNSQGISSHMRSSEGVPRYRNSKFSFTRRSSTSQLLNSQISNTPTTPRNEYNNNKTVNKYKRIK